MLQNCVAGLEKSCQKLWQSLQPYACSYLTSVLARILNPRGVLVYTIHKFANDTYTHLAILIYIWGINISVYPRVQEGKSLIKGNNAKGYGYSALQVGCQKKTDRVFLVVLYQHYISQLVVYLQHCGLYNAHVHYKTTRCTLSVFF